MVSEDSQHLGRLPEVHRLLDLCDLDQTRDREMPALIHQLDDPSELGEVVSFRCSQWVRLEERDDDVPEISVPLDAVPEEILTMVVVPAVAVHATAAEELDHLFEHVTTRCTLHDGKFRSNLPSESHRVATIDGAAEAAFPIDETHEPPNGGESFLLVFRTRGIVTDVHRRTLGTGCDDGAE